MMKKFAVIVLSAVVTLSAAAQENTGRLSVALEGDYLTIVSYRNTYVPGKTIFPSHAVELDFSTLPTDGDSFAAVMNYPVFGVGFGHSSLSQVEFRSPNGHYDDMFHLYGTMDRELLRRQWISLGYDALLGLTYTDGVYDAFTNTGNWFFSTRVLFYIGAGFHMKLRPIPGYRRLELETDAFFRHCSSARFGYPNSGYNGAGAGLTLRHYLNENAAVPASGQRQRKVSPDDWEAQKGMHWRMVAGGGVHACSAEWLAWCGRVKDPAQRRTDFRKWPMASLAAEAVYRYSGRFASGVSAEFFYNTTTGMLQEADTILYGSEAVEECSGYSPYSGGFGLVQECYYGPFALYVNAGMYLYRRMGIHADHGRFWQRAGLRCYPQRLHPFFFGASCKAHNFRAEYLDFTVGLDF